MTAPPGSAPAPGASSEAASAPAPGSTAKKNPRALDIEDLARLMRASGSRHADADRVRDDIDAGAPTNRDGSLNLVHFGAWLVRQVLASEAARGN